MTKTGYFCLNLINLYDLRYLRGNARRWFILNQWYEKKHYRIRTWHKFDISKGKFSEGFIGGLLSKNISYVFYKINIVRLERAIK
jgi:hypothetical protein